MTGIPVVTGAGGGGGSGGVDVSIIGESPMRVAIRSVDMPWGSGSVSGMLMTLLSSLMTDAACNGDVEDFSSKRGSALMPSLVSSTTSMCSGGGTGGAVTSITGVAGVDE